MEPHFLETPDERSLQLGTITNIAMVVAAEVVLFGTQSPLHQMNCSSCSLLADAIRKNVGTQFSQAQP